MEKLRKLQDLSGYITSVAAGLASVLSAACVQKLGQTVPPFQLNAARYFVQVLMSLCVAVCSKKTLRITAIKVPWLLLLTVFSVAYNTFYFTAAQYLPLGNLTITYVTLLYIATVLWSKIFLDKDIHLVQLGLFVVILLGQFLLLQPCPPFNTENFQFYNVDVNNLTQVPDNTTTTGGGSGTDTNQDGYIYSLVGYALVAGASTASAWRAFVYRTTMKEINTGVLSLWTGLLALVASLLLMTYTETPVLLTASRELLLLTGHAVLAATCSILIVHTQQVLNPIVYSILQNMRAVYGFILQYSLPHVLLPGHGNVLEAVGAVVIMLGTSVYVFIDIKIKDVMSLDNM